ncbi:MAG: aspartate 1-decarboxylase [Planctomycetota bacterium]
MLIKILRAKIHLATVTEACLDYVGSVTIDRDLLDATGMVPGESVLVANRANGARLETYIFEGERGSGVICLNGAAARSAEVGDKLIIMSFGWAEPEEAKTVKPQVVLVDEKNRVTQRL